jgi:hypothetical protein
MRNECATNEDLDANHGTMVAVRRPASMMMWKIGELIELDE